jgi:hypothetical protein
MFVPGLYAGGGGGPEAAGGGGEYTETVVDEVEVAVTVAVPPAKANDL